MADTEENTTTITKSTKKNLNDFVDTTIDPKNLRNIVNVIEANKQVITEQPEPIKMNTGIKSPGKRATAEAKVKTLSMAKSGRTPEEIAQATGFVSRTIRQWLEEAEEPITPEKIREVLQLAEQKCSRDEIHWRTLLSIQNVQEIRKRLVVVKYIQGKSVNEICTTYNIDDDAITKMLREAGVKKQKQQEMGTLQMRLQNTNGEYESYRPLSAYLEEMIIGNVFGDANITLQTHNVKKRESLEQPLPSLEMYEKGLKFFQYTQTINTETITSNEMLKDLVNEYNIASKIIVTYPTAYFRMNVSILELRYLEQGIAKKLEEHNYPVHLKIEVAKEYIGKQFTGNYKLKVHMQTISTVQLATKYQQWYPNNIKVIPKDISFTSNSIFLLYVDDGSYSKSNRDYDVIMKAYSRSNLEISTESFTKDDLQLFVNTIQQIAKVTFHINRSKNNRWRISLSHRDEIQQFLNYITTNADHNLVSLAKREFPWKFNHNLTKKEILNERRNQNNPDPLITLYDLRFSKEKSQDPEFMDYINHLLEKVGSEIKVTNNFINKSNIHSNS